MRYKENEGELKGQNDKTDNSDTDKKSEAFLPSSTVTFPLKKNFPWPLESATPRLQYKQKYLHLTSSLCRKTVNTVTLNFYQ